MKEKGRKKPSRKLRCIKRKSKGHKRKIYLFLFIDSRSRECFSFHSFFLVFLGKITELSLNFFYVILIQVVSIEHNTIPMSSITSVY